MRVSRYLRTLDDAVFAAEGALVALALVVMAVAVFIDVVWRTSHSLTGPAAWVMLLALLVLCVVGGLTRRASETASKPRRIAHGLVAFAISLSLGTLIYMAPTGFGWSQRLALVLLLWVGLFGASMATREARHISVDAVRRIVPPDKKRFFEIAAGVVTVALTTILTVLGGIYVAGNWSDWIESDGASAVFESIPIPYWAATLPIPMSFGIMTARFLGFMMHPPDEADLLTSLGGGAHPSADRSTTAEQP